MRSRGGPRALWASGCKSGCTLVHVPAVNLPLCFPPLRDSAFYGVSLIKAPNEDFRLILLFSTSKIFTNLTENEVPSFLVT